MACVFSVLALIVFNGVRGQVLISPASYMFLVLVPVPLVQYGFGLIYFSGEAIIYSLYLAGAAAAVALGGLLEQHRKYLAADLFFLAVLAGAFFSVLLQLHERLGLDLSELYVLRTGPYRPSANLGQPNNLGTLLVWGLLALIWLARRHQLSVIIGLLLGAPIFWGVVLTESRAALVGILLTGIVLFSKRELFSSVDFKKKIYISVASGVLVALFLTRLYFLGSAAQVDGLFAFLRIGGDSPRLRALSMFLSAALERPWFGFGWNQVVQAQLLVAESYQPFYQGWGSSHNLFVDIILWVGIPLGLFVSVLILIYLVLFYKKVSTPEQVICFCVLLVGLNHSVVEFPLYYAYFLLPLSLVLGGVESSIFLFRLPLRLKLFVALCMGLVLVLSVVIHDYFVVEERYRELRLEWQGFRPVEKITDEAMILNQWNEVIRLARFSPYVGMSEMEIEWMVKAASFSQRPRYLLIVAKGLAINGRIKEAEHWLRTICKVSPPDQCISARKKWNQMIEEDSRLKSVIDKAWP